MADWDDNPDLYQKDENGNFLLKKDGTPRKVRGRPKGVKIVLIIFIVKLKKRLENVELLEPKKRK